MKAIQYLDGKITIAPTWEEIEAAWNNDFMNAVIEPEAFRDTIAGRAKAWSGATVRTAGTAEEFLADCAKAGLITLGSGNVIEFPARRK